MSVKVPLTTRPAQGVSFWLIQSPEGTSVLVQMGSLTRDGFKARQRAMRRVSVVAPDLNDAGLVEILESGVQALVAALREASEASDTPG